MFEKENGAKLGVPAVLRVLIQPIGRGTTSAVMGLCKSPNSSRPFAVLSCAGSKKMLLMNSVSEAPRDVCSSRFDGLRHTCLGLSVFDLGLSYVEYFLTSPDFK
jgi:hypothetical protein